jgi:hypothetical protein
MKIWQILEQLFTESKQYRGDTGMRKVDLEKLIDAIKKQPDAQLEGEPVIDPNGGSFSCQYSFNPNIWGKWFSSQDTALTNASSDKDPYVGKPQGGMTFKKNWGGSVVHVPGKPRTDHERMPSAMDRYDVLMQGEVNSKQVINHKAKKIETVSKGVLLRVAYAPSIGDAEERRARLVSLMSNTSAPPLSRRPQPEIPGKVKDPTKQPDGNDDPQWADKVARSVPDVPRQGGLMGRGNKMTRDTDDENPRRHAGGTAQNTDFAKKLAAHDKSYKPTAKRPDYSEPDEDDPDRLFGPGMIPRSKR